MLKLSIGRKRKATMRIFFAVDLPEKTKTEIGEISAELQKKHKHHAIRWTKPENMHVTLQFQANVNETDIPQLIQNVRAEIQGFESFELQLEKIELFPTPYRPHVISIKLNPNPVLAMLSSQIGSGVVKTGYEIEKRPFRGHLTLARLPPAKKLFELDEITFSGLEKVRVQQIILYKSEPGEKGSRYTKLETIELKHKN